MMQITRLLNLPTDVSDRMQLKRSEVHMSQALRRKNQLQQPDLIAVDLLPIVLNLDDDFPFEGTSTSLNFSGHHHISQGQMVAIIGGSGAGKRTLLRLISGRMLPESLEGDNGAFVPSHLRIICVSDASIFYSGTLYENLIFGMNKDSPEASKDRAVQLCKQLGVHDNVLACMDMEPDWEAIFSEAQRKLVNIARALINNAEVICLDKPLAKFDPAKGAKVAQAISEHVQRKGLALQSHPLTRRPRTAFLSSCQPIIHAQTQYLVSRDTGISMVTHQEAVALLEVSIENERSL
jgi:ABC-type bacteriocin/lantibiotic exporter with double-glycine peptidase domain